MWLKELYKRWLDRPQSAAQAASLCRQGRRQASPRGGIRPILEQLEDRYLLSGADLTVMSYNLYQGSELAQALTVPSLAQLPAAVSAIEAEVAATDIPGRATSWAKQVADARPDVLALQEVSLWRIQTPGTTLTGHQTPATTVLYDFIGSLVNHLAAQGLRYTVVGTVNGLDIQGPDATGNDLRLTDRVALLARTDEPPGQLRWTNVQSADYHTNPVLNVGGPSGLTVTVFNGWISADFTKRGETFRVITTHLDAFVPAIGDAQAHELIDGPANTTLPVIVMGDLNSPADSSGSPAHQDFLAAGFQDTWTATHGSDPGFTAQPTVDLTAPNFGATQRIDYVFTRGGFSADGMTVEGTDPEDKTASGLWPSDHAAIVAKLDLPKHQSDGDSEGRAINEQHARESLVASQNAGLAAFGSNPIPSDFQMDRPMDTTAPMQWTQNQSWLDLANAMGLDDSDSAHTHARVAYHSSVNDSDFGWISVPFSDLVS
jgi:endonuclease/exonuclease/phosphatase family metal-dependent hydrolase